MINKIIIVNHACCQLKSTSKVNDFTFVYQIQKYYLQVQFLLQIAKYTTCLIVFTILIYML